MRQCVAGGKQSNFSMVAGLEAKDECRSAMDALKQSPLYNCNDFLEDSPYEPVNSRLSDIFRLAPILGEPAVTRENNCLNAAKACNLNDTCKKYRSAYISPCTSRVSSAEICNKRKCHKALRQFFDKVPPKHSYGMLFCSCPPGDQSACSERRRQTIVPVCSYDEKQKPNCLELQGSCKTNYICRSIRQAAQPLYRQLLHHSALHPTRPECFFSHRTIVTPNYLRSPKISVSPFCDCSSSGNNKDECGKFTEFFTDNTCLPVLASSVCPSSRTLMIAGPPSQTVTWSTFPKLATNTAEILRKRQQRQYLRKYHTPAGICVVPRHIVKQ
ncbi:hypothetical protein CRUP_015683 [Coryphaenoides rupestris]|nr:hypothetical protein CRUP_015683 [Coryphaenoides rupestris]